MRSLVSMIQLTSPGLPSRQFGVRDNWRCLPAPTQRAGIVSDDGFGHESINQSYLSLTANGLCCHLVIGMSITIQLDLPEALVKEARANGQIQRSEEHTSELQSQSNLVCRL